STTPSTSLPWRCAHDRNRRHLLPGTAQPPTVAAPPWKLARRRGMALPGVGALLRTPGGPAAPVRRRRTSRRPHPGRHPGAGGTTRRPVRTAVVLRMARPLDPAGTARGLPVAWTRPALRPGLSRVPSRTPCTRRGGIPMATRILPAASVLAGLTGDRTARWSGHSPVPATTRPAGAGVRAAHRAGRHDVADRTPPRRHLGPRMRLRTGHGGRLRRGRGAPIPRRRSVLAW